MENTSDFIHVFDSYLMPGAYLCAAAAVLILLYHEFRIFQIRDYKAKYDYVNLYEIRYFWYAVMSLIVGASLYFDALASGFPVFGSQETWFYVRNFLTVSFAIVTYFIFYSLVRIYYPRFVEKRLTKLRGKPRISPQGNRMRKLNEVEEEAHLEPAQFNEQSEVHSIDYDVWLDEKTGYKKIEKYNSYQHAIECSECGYVTLKINHEEVIKAPGETEGGLLIKHYKCSYCDHREAKEVNIAPLLQNIT